MSKRLIFRYTYVLCAIIVLGFGLVRMGFLGAAKDWGLKTPEEQTKFRTAVKNVAEALQKQPDDMRDDEQNVPLKKVIEYASEWLNNKLRNTDFINHTHQYSVLNGQQANFLQIAVNERALAQNNAERAAELDKIITFLLAKDPKKANLSGTLRIGPNLNDPAISLLHFALKNGLTKTVKDLLVYWEKPVSLVSNESLSLSVYPYAFEGKITDPKLLITLSDRGALPQEADFDYFKDSAKKIAFLAWLKENKVPTKNAQAKVMTLEKEAEALIANKTITNFARSLEKILHQ